MRTANDPGIAPGAIVWGALGLILGIISVAVPWSGTWSSAGGSLEETTVGFVDMGAGAVLFAGAMLLAAASIPVVLKCNGTARTIVALGGMGAAAVAAVGLGLAQLRLRAMHLELTRSWAQLADDAGETHIAVQMGPAIAGLCLALLVVAITRAAWPAQPVRCYGLASLAALIISFMYPWGYQRAAFGTDVVIRDVWFISFGFLGFAIAAAGAYAVVAVILTVYFERRAWWPAVAAVSAPLILLVVAVGFVDNDQIATTFEGASKVDGPVDNTYIACLYLLVGLVTAICLLVTAVRADRRPTTVTVPAIDPRSGPPPMPMHPPYAPPASPYVQPGPPPGPQAPPPPGPRQPW
ncbi:MAG: hypothetical protein GEV10_06155 [Streptosporangiales bacterium]|nr:hypothetical protein [Streptosporangiales bacterium]